eukprot:1014016-Amphidinium_carterae.1
MAITFTHIYHIQISHNNSLNKPRLKRKRPRRPATEQDRAEILSTFCALWTQKCCISSAPSVMGIRNTLRHLSPSCRNPSGSKTSKHSFSKRSNAAIPPFAIIVQHHF